MLQKFHSLALPMCVFLFTAALLNKAASRFDASDPDWVAKSDGNSHYTNGIYVSSPNPMFTDEVNMTARLLKLKPGVVYCELGASNGLWAVALGARIMPGGQIWGTVGTEEEKPVFLAALTLAGIPANVSRGYDVISGLPQDGRCDVIMSRMSFFYVSHPVAYARQLFFALKSGGRMLITDHGAMEGLYTGPRGASSLMKVTMGTEQADFEAAGFKMLQQLDWSPFFFKGFANLMEKPVSM